MHLFIKWYENHSTFPPESDVASSTPKIQRIQTHWQLYPGTGIIRFAKSRCYSDQLTLSICLCICLVFWKLLYYNFMALHFFPSRKGDLASRTTECVVSCQVFLSWEWTEYEQANWSIFYHYHFSQSGHDLFSRFIIYLFIYLCSISILMDTFNRPFLWQSKVRNFKK